MDEHVIVSGDAETVKRESARRTRRSFIVGGVAAAAAYGILHWINNSAAVDRLQGVLRKTLDIDAAVNRAVFGERGLAPTYALSRSRVLRLNGTIGLERKLVVESWRLQAAGVAEAEKFARYVKDVTAWEYGYTEEAKPSELAPDFKSAPTVESGKDLESAPKVNGLPHLSIAERFEAMAQQVSGKKRQGDAEAGASANSLNIGTPGLLLTMEDLLKLPRVELVTEFKCIEGWSEITQWGGVRLRDFIEAYPPAKVNGREPRYVYMETPDGDFYCGYDMAAARHPQSLLVTEMSGQPLAHEHGAPLRLHMPIKYGYKQIKRIGLIAYTDQKPEDYWTKLGYDWYAGI